MRSKNVAAVLLVAAGASMTMVLSAPASAAPGDDTQTQQTDQTDQAFLKALHDRGLTLKSDDYAINLAHSTCDLLTKTGSTNDALRHVKKWTDWSDTDKIVNFGSLAVQGYCPKSMPKQ